MNSLTVEQLMQTRSALKIVIGLLDGLGSDTDELKTMLKRINGVLTERGARGLDEREIILPTEDVGMPIPLMDWQCMGCPHCVDGFNRKYGTTVRVEDSTARV